MTAKEYLNQAGGIELKLKCMAEQLESLRNAAVYFAPIMSDMPKPPTLNVHKMEDVIIRIVQLEDEMRAEFNRLADINAVMNSVPDPLQQATLVKRYIAGKPWDIIAGEIHVSTSQVYRLHKDALAEVEKIIKNRTVNESN